MLILALPKGRLFAKCLQHLARLGLTESATKQLAQLENNRQLSCKINSELTLFKVRNSDVITYVKNNLADLALVGSDMLLEDQDNGTYYYDYGGAGFSSCRLMVAALPQYKGKDFTKRRKVRVATSYPKVAAKFYAGKGMQAEILKINGSVELAAAAGFVDHIVDIVDTGKTLRDNNLVTLEKIADVSPRVIINKGIMRTKWRRISALADRLID